MPFISSLDAQHPTRQDKKEKIGGKKESKTQDASHMKKGEVQQVYLAKYLPKPEHRQFFASTLLPFFLIFSSHVQMLP